MQVGGYRLIYDGRELAAPTETPPWHRQFASVGDEADFEQIAALSHQLTLTLQNRDMPDTTNWEKLIWRNEIWELWLDEQGDFALTNPMQRLRRCLFVDQAFSHGSIAGNFSSGAGCYPLPQDLEIVFFINWIGEQGDLLLHASGIALNGEGYAFAGPSGVGKSTLAAALATKPGVTILGEDQLLLRFMDGQFWIFGTPWHSSSAMCSPMGVPLKQLYFLQKDGTQKLSPVPAMEAVTRLLQTAFIPYYRPELVEKHLGTIEHLSTSISMAELSYRLGADVLKIISKNHA